MELKLLIIKGYYSGLSGKTQYNHKGPLNVEEEGRRVSVRVMQCEKDLNSQCWLRENKKGSQAKEHGQPRTGKVKTNKQNRKETKTDSTLVPTEGK